MFQKDIYQKHDFTLHYNLDFPAGFDPQNTYPILFYFHGMGGVGQGADYIAEHGPLQRSRMPEDTPYQPVGRSLRADPPRRSKPRRVDADIYGSRDVSMAVRAKEGLSPS